MDETKIKNVVIVGAGTMGQQISLVCAFHNKNVILYDIKEDILEKALVNIKKMADKYCNKNHFPKKDIPQKLSYIKTSTSIETASINADILIENVPEDPNLKKKVFRSFNEFCPQHTIFTTNTSTLLPSMFAQETGRGDRLAAFHFHDVLMSNVVDIMPHPGTSKETINQIGSFARNIGQQAILLKKEQIGYVFNYMIMALFEAAQTLASKDVASVQDIDRAWMGVTGMEIGPFGLMDGIGIDTVWSIANFWGITTKDKKVIRNAEFLKQYVDAKTLGKKTQKGFYSYPKPEFNDKDFLLS
jgi:3-hydroxybutyryl-CoA dehydrogenase